MNNNLYIYTGVQTNYLVQRGYISPAPILLTDMYKRYVMEVFKDIKGYEGLYQISNLGRVKSVGRYVIRKSGIEHLRKCWRKEIIMRLCNGYVGYKVLVLRKNNQPKTHLVSRLVALNFIPNPDNKPEVNHKNGIKSNNTVDNLEWMTSSENKIHALETGLKIIPRGEQMSNWTKEDILKIRSMVGKGLSYTKIGKQFGMSGTNVGHIHHRRSWTHI